jgi:putative acetyltransferase
MIKIYTPVTEADLEITRQLNRQYLDWLAEDGVVSCYLTQQKALDIVNQLPEGHQFPEGDLLLATHKGEPVGTVALKKIEDGVCEMKRLYVLPQARHLRIGYHLVSTIIERARQLGYTKMQLDSLPHMTAAQNLYRHFGFEEIENYNNNHVGGAIFMSLKL